MKLSARNQLKGKVLEVTKGATTSHVRIEIGPGAGRVAPEAGRHLDIQPERPFNLTHQVRQRPGHVPAQGPQFGRELGEAHVTGPRVRLRLPEVVKRLHQAARVGGEIRDGLRQSITRPGRLRRTRLARSLGLVR